MTTSTRVQHTAIELTYIVLHCYGYVLLKEYVKNTWSVNLEVKVV
jgi:hypothetical protein